MIKTRIIKTCPVCKVEFKVYPSGAGRKHCSKQCADIAQTTSEQKDIICIKCGKHFNTKKDHGIWPKYCSRTCFEKGAPRPTLKPCPACKKPFLATRSTRRTNDGLKKHCSIGCRNIAHRKEKTEKKCINCGKIFYLHKSVTAKRKEHGCCSIKCQRGHYIGEKSHSWKGGKYVDTTTNTNRIYSPDNPTVDTHWGEHRLIVSEAIGRTLTRDDFVIHLNSDNMDNNKNNLYVCTNSTFSKIRQGSLPWPKTSNLAEYK